MEFSSWVFSARVNDMRKPEKKWIDPVKGKPAHAETLSVKGDFKEFKEIMRRLVNKREEKPTPSSSRVPGAS
jgi:hypothetical protein